MQKTILPKDISDLYDYYIVARAYANRLQPKLGFVGGFNMMVMAGVSINPQPTIEEKPDKVLINLLEETIHKLDTELQTRLSHFFLSVLNNITMDYRLLPMTNGDEAELNRQTPTEYYPSLLFIDEAISKIIDAIGRIDIEKILVTKATNRANEICIVFDNRKSLIQYVKDRDITIKAFGKKWKP